MSKLFSCVPARWIIAGGIWGLCIVIFWPITHHDFVAFDDDINIYLNEHIGKPTLPRLLWIATDTTYVRRYIPITWLSYSAIITFFGLGPFGFHAAGVMFHAINAVLLFFLTRTFVRFISTRCTEGMATGVSAIGALWWSFNPLRAEVVAWASGLGYSMATTLFLVAVILHIKSHSYNSGSGWRWCGALFFLSSLLTYPIMLGGGGALFAYEYYRISGGGFDEWRSPMYCLRSACSRAFPWLCISFAVLIITAYASARAEQFWDTGVKAHWSERWLELPYFIGYYLWKPWWPSRLSPVYDTLIAPNFNTVEFLIHYVFFAVGVGVVIWAIKSKRSGVLLFSAVYLAMLIPLAGMTSEVRFPSDRYSHTLQLLLVLGVAVIFVRCTTASLKFGGPLVLLILTLAWIPTTCVQIDYWTNTEKLLGRALQVLNRSVYIKGAIVLRLVSFRLYYKGDADGARRLLVAESNNIDPKQYKESLDRIELDRLHFKKESETFVASPSLMLLKIVNETDLPHDDIPSAIVRLEEALRWSGDFWQARFMLSTLLLAQGDVDSASSNFNLAVSVPGSAISPEVKAHFLQELDQAYVRRAQKTGVQALPR